MADYSRWKQYGASELWSQHKPYSPSQPRRATFRRALDDYTLTAPDLTKAEWSSDFADYGSLSLDRNGPRSSRSGRRQGVSSRSYDDDEGDEADIPVRASGSTRCARPHEAVGSAPGLAHAWEKHHVLSWARVAGLDDLVAKFRAANLSGKELLRLAPRSVASTLKLGADEPAAFRVCAALAHLKARWGAARRAAGLPTKLEDDAIARHKRLLADLHVHISGAAVLPPGASGAYVLLELGEHKARSSFVPAAGGGGGGDGGGSGFYVDDPRTNAARFTPAWPQSSSGFLVHDPPLDGRYALHPAAVNVAADALPQSFMLTIDEDTLGGADTLHLDVCAWFPQLGERSIGRVDVPLPDAGGPSVRLKLSDPLDIELHWRAYGAPASPGKGEWEAEAEPVYPPYGGGDW